MKLLLETNPKHSFGTYCDSVSGTANIVENTTDGMRIEVNSTTPALLFVSQNYFTSWSAKVNGRTADIYPADLAFMAIEVPNGKSLVEFKQRLF